MKFYQLIKSYNWLSIELTLLQLYPDQHVMLDEYRNVFEKLNTLTPEDDDMLIVLTDCDTEFKGEKETYVDVSGRKRIREPDRIDCSYAIEFVAWNKWLGMDLAEETVEHFTDLEIIAHCLFEMTFVGYEEEEIQEQFDAINDRVEEYKNLTEEEKEIKTISLEEMMKRHNIIFDDEHPTGN